jgi:Uma2 family endonuclease
LTAHLATAQTLEDRLQELGGIPASRLRMIPYPGRAKVDDLIDINERQKSGLVELVDSCLVDKSVGFEASVVAMAIVRILGTHVFKHRLGIVSGPDGMFQLQSSIRGPDVAYVSKDRLPDRRFPNESYPAIAPNLVVEVLSPGNTKGEMTRKRLEYFHAGVQIVWIVDCVNRSVAVYTDPATFEVVSAEETIEGAIALPGFSAIVKDFFADLDIGTT